MTVMENETHVNAEVDHNALLISIRQGGILYDYIESGPAEVLCVPEESFLKHSGLEPYLLLPALSMSIGSAMSSVTLTVDGSTRQLTRRQHAEVARILREQFLDYHTLHFQDVASDTFTTLRGQQGAFSSNLESVSRYGRVGNCTVISDSDPLVDRNDPDLSDFHPCKLHIYFIKEPLMDEQEIQNTLIALSRAVFPPTVQHQQQQQQQQSPPPPQTTVSSDVVIPGHSISTSDRFSRESIAKYRRSVATDYDVHYSEFQEYMEMPVCVPLVRTLSTFVETVQQRELPPLTSTDVKRAITACMKHCKRIPFLAQDEAKQRIALEGFEKYIMTKLYWRAFDVDPEDQQRNAHLTLKLRQLSPLVLATQLDAIPTLEENPLWGEAIFELEGMNYFKSPHEKLRCAVRACRLLSTAIRSAISAGEGEPHASGKDSGRTSGSRSGNHESSDPGSGSGSGSAENSPTFGADEFLPCFILLVLRASPRNYYLNLRYVKRFRNETFMTHEESYCLASMESAAEFWLSYDEAQPRERVETSPKQKNQQQENQQQENQQQGLPPPSIDDLFPISSDASCAISQKTNTIFSLQLPLVLDDEVELNGGTNTCSNNNTFGATTMKERINVAALLLEEQKSFEELTVSELRAIVVEARFLLAEKQLRRENSHTEVPRNE